MAVFERSWMGLEQMGSINMKELSLLRKQKVLPDYPLVVFSLKTYDSDTQTGARGVL